MRRRRAIIGAVWLALGLASGAPGVFASPVQAEIAAKTVRGDVYPRRPVRFSGGIVGHADVEYANLVGFRPLLLDVYAHEHSGSGRLPLVVWIHGGGWNRGDSRTSGAYADWPAVLASLAARGYVVASVNYRLSGEARFPAQIQDVKAAVRYLRAHAGQYGIDPARVYVWGGSAGGHLAALAATSCGVAAFEPEPSTGRLPKSLRPAADAAASDCVQGAAVWYGVFDLETAGTGGIASLLGCDPAACAAAARTASPASYADSADPPMLLAHGTADKEAPVRQAEEMAARLRAAGARVQTLFIRGADHGWIGPDPAATRQASLLALQRTFDFFDSIRGGRR